MSGAFRRDGRDFYNTPDGQLVSVDAGFDVATAYQGLTPATADDVAARDYEKSRAPVDVKSEFNRNEQGDLNPDAALGTSDVPQDSDGLAKIKEFIALEPTPPEAPKAFSKDGRDYYVGGDGKLVSLDAGFDPTEEYPDLKPATAEQVHAREIQKRSGHLIDRVETYGHTAAAATIELGAFAYNLARDDVGRLLWPPSAHGYQPVKASELAPGLYGAKEKEQREANPATAFISAAVPDLAANLLLPGAGVETAAARTAVAAAERASLLARIGRAAASAGSHAVTEAIGAGPRTAAARILASSMVTEAGDAVIEGHEFDMGKALGVWAPTQLAFELGGNTALRGVATALGAGRNAVTNALERSRTTAVNDALREVDPAKRAEKLIRNSARIYEKAQTELDTALGVIDERLASAPEKLFTNSALKRSVSSNLRAQADTMVELAVQAAHAAEVTGAPTLEKAAKLLDGVRGSSGPVLYKTLREVRSLLTEAGEASGERSWASYALDNPLAREMVENVEKTLADENVWGRAARDHTTMLAEAARAPAPVKRSVRDLTAREALTERLEQARRVSSIGKDEVLGKAAEQARGALGMADEVTGAHLLGDKASNETITAMRKMLDAFPDRAEKLGQTVTRGLERLAGIADNLLPDTWTAQRVETHIAERAAGSKAARAELDDALRQAEKLTAQGKKAGTLTAAKAAKADAQIAALRGALDEVDEAYKASKTVRDYDAGSRNVVEQTIDKVTGKVASKLASRAVSTAAATAAGYAGGGVPGALAGMVGGEAINHVIEPIIKEKASKFAGWLKDKLRQHGRHGAAVAALYGANELANDENDPSPQAAAAIGMLALPGLGSLFERKGSLRVLRERVRRTYSQFTPEMLARVDRHIGEHVATLGDELIKGNRADVEAIIERAKAAVAHGVQNELVEIGGSLNRAAIDLRVEHTFAEAAHQLPRAAAEARPSKLREYLEQERAGVQQKGKYDEHPMMRAFPPGSYEQYRTEQLQIGHQLEEAGDGELVKTMNHVIDFNADRFVKNALHAAPDDAAAHIQTELQSLIDEFTRRYEDGWRFSAGGNGKLSNVERRYITNSVKAKIMSAWQVTLENVALQHGESLAGKGIDIRRAMKPGPYGDAPRERVENAVRKMGETTDESALRKLRDQAHDAMVFKLTAEARIKMSEAHAVTDHVIDEMLAGRSWPDAVDDAARVVNEQAETVALTNDRHYKAAAAFSDWEPKASMNLGFSVKQAVKDYAGDFDYKNINALAREGEEAFTKASNAERVEWSKAPDPKAIKRNRKQAEDLQLALDYAVDNGYTAPGRTWRGVLFSPAELKRISVAAGKGAPVEAHAFMSTSTNEDYAMRFIERKEALKQNPKLRKVIFEVIQKNGVPVNIDESEVLLRAGTRFRVEEIPTRLREHARFRATELDDLPRLPSDMKHGAGGKNALPWIAGGVFALGGAEALTNDDDTGAKAASAGGLGLLALLMQHGKGPRAASRAARETAALMGLSGATVRRIDQLVEKARPALLETFTDAVRTGRISTPDELVSEQVQHFDRVLSGQPLNDAERAYLDAEIRHQNMRSVESDGYLRGVVEHETAAPASARHAPPGRRDTDVMRELSADEIDAWSSRFDNNAAGPTFSAEAVDKVIERLREDHAMPPAVEVYLRDQLGQTAGDWAHDIRTAASRAGDNYSGAARDVRHADIDADDVIRIINDGETGAHDFVLTPWNEHGIRTQFADSEDEFVQAFRDSAAETAGHVQARREAEESQRPWAADRPFEADRAADGFDGLPRDSDAMHAAGINVIRVNDENAVERIFGQELSLDDMHELFGLQELTRYAADSGKELDSALTVGTGYVKFRGQVGAMHIERIYTPRVDARGNARGYDIHNAYFILPDKLQAAGTGKKILRGMADANERLGGKAMSLDAAWIGRYIWAKLGFRPSVAAEVAARDAFASDLLDWTGRARPLVGATVGGIKTIRDLADVRIPLDAVQGNLAAIKRAWATDQANQPSWMKKVPFENALIKRGKAGAPDEFLAGKAFLLTRQGRWNAEMHIAIEPGTPWYDEYRKRIGASAIVVGFGLRELLETMNETRTTVWTSKSPRQEDDDDAAEADQVLTQARTQATAINEAREQDLDETRDRLAYLSHQGRTLVDTAARTLAGGSAANDNARNVERVPGVTGSAGVARFLGSHSNLHEAFAEKKRLLESVQRNPLALVDEMADSLAELQDRAPALHSQVARKTFEIAKFLQSKVPVPVGASIVRPEGVQVNSLAVRQFALYYSAATDPASVVTDLANNRARREQVDTLRQVWPETYQDLKLSVLGLMSEKRPTVAQRIRLDLLFDFGQQFDRGLSPGLVASLDAYRKQQGAQDGATPGAGKQAPQRRSQGSVASTSATGSLNLGPAAGPGTMA